MKILSVKGKNLLSLGEFELKFDDSGLVLVEGWNYDDGRANGAGKTAIFNLLSLAIYTKIPRRITMGELIKRGERRGEVTAEVLVGSDTYSLLYGRPKKRVIKKNGKEIDITQEELEERLGLTYDNFLISMYTVQGGDNKFLDLNDTDKKDFLLKLMNLNKFQECKKEAIRIANDMESELFQFELKLGKAESQLEAYSSMSVDPEAIKAKIVAINTDIGKYNSQIAELQNVPAPDLKKFYELEAKIKSKRDEFSSLKRERQILMQNYVSLERSITPFSEKKPNAHCPQCNTGLSVSNNTVAAIEDQSALRKQHEAHVDSLKEQMKDLKSKMDDIDTKLYEENSINQLEVKVKEKKEKESSSYDKAQNSIRDLQFSINSKRSDITRLQQDLEQAESISDKKKTLIAFIDKAAPAIEDKKKQMSIYRSVANMYSPTGAPAYIMDTIVETFNEAVNEHISLVWPSASYKLVSHKENSKGDIIAKFSETLVINGHMTSIGALSGGEKRAFSLSIDFAVADVLSRQFGMPLNPIIMDEPFEGLDSTGREVVIELLEKLSANRQIWVIDHASEAKSMFSHILRVEKRNGTSTINTLDMI